MVYLLKMVIFYSYVKLPEGKMKQSNHGLSSNRQIHTSSLPWQCPRRWLDVEGRKPHGGHRKTEWFNHLLTAIDLVVHTKTNESQHLHVSMCHIHIEYICINTYNKHTYYIHMHIYIEFGFETDCKNSPGSAAHTTCIQ